MKKNPQIQGHIHPPLLSFPTSERHLSYNSNICETDGDSRITQATPPPPTQRSAEGVCLPSVCVKLNRDIYGVNIYHADTFSSAGNKWFESFLPVWCCFYMCQRKNIVVPLWLDDAHFYYSRHHVQHKSVYRPRIDSNHALMQNIHQYFCPLQVFLIVCSVIAVLV